MPGEAGSSLPISRAALGTECGLWDMLQGQEYITKFGPNHLKGTCFLLGQ